MESGLAILPFMNWIGYFFPSLSQYIEVVCPIIIVMFGAISIFSNILPKPGYLFMVPSEEDLCTELIDHPKAILRLAKLSRQITLIVNKGIQSTTYDHVYAFTKRCTWLLSYLKLSRNLNRIRKVDPPELYVPKAKKDASGGS